MSDGVVLVGILRGHVVAVNIDPDSWPTARRDWTHYYGYKVEEMPHGEAMRRLDEYRAWEKARL